MRKWLVLILLALGIVTAHPYGNRDTLNAGVYWGTDQRAVGFEYRGDPGPIACDENECYPMPNNQLIVFGAGSALALLVLALVEIDRINSAREAARQGRMTTFPTHHTGNRHQ